MIRPPPQSTRTDTLLPETSRFRSPATKPASFAATLEDALQSVNAQQRQAGALSESYERGETIDIAKVMLARQQASVGVEATLQVRNKLVSAYQDIRSDERSVGKEGVSTLRSWGSPDD